MKLEEAIKSTNFSSQKQKAGLNILYTAWWLKNLLSKELKAFALTHEQYNVLRILKGKHPEKMCIRDIGGRMIEPNSNVPRIIDRLEIKKLVKRSTSAVDKRETVITLTDAGINILALATQRIDAILENSVDIPEADANQLNQLLDNFRKT
ncbi:winged helix DNA-binding protein [Aridibaculum aurantiacum]|uniref:winged helix DNA-binding protein n=1 Tax=Aridibaculum aurantiacum TaxID=2810307 RepID=UPI001A97CB6B